METAAVTATPDVKAKRKRRSYSDEEKAAALTLYTANSGLDAPLKATANQLQIPDSNVLAWSQGRGVSPRVAELVEQEKRTLADLFRRAVEKGLSEILQADTPATWRDSTGIATFADKYLVLTGQPDHITESRTITAELRIEAEAALADLIALCGDRAQALADMQRIAPTLARALPAEQSGEAAGATDCAGDAAQNVTETK